MAREAILDIIHNIRGQDAATVRQQNIMIVPRSLVPYTLSFAYGARPSLREWGERNGYASNTVELATHRPCSVRARVCPEP
eukprot:135013-Pleurochrysis_carterae.AAC.1